MRRFFRTTWASSLLLALVLSCVTTTVVFAKSLDVSLNELFPTERQVKTTLVINKVLERFHYRRFQLTREFAAQALDSYFEDLDINRLFFLERDVTRFISNAAQLHDQLQLGKVDIAFDIFRIYRMRVDSRIEYALALLDQPFNFNRDETYRFDRSKSAWAANEQQLNDIWRKRVKNDFLTLRLAGKNDHEIIKQLRKRYEGIMRRIHQFTIDDVYQTFANAYIRTLEPHTAYMSPSTSENFDISMRLSLEGIGAVLGADNEYTVIQRTIPGGPARQSGQIRTGDSIVGVAQGLDGDMEDVVGWRLQDVVDKVRGPKGSVVRLQILPKAEGTASRRLREVTLVRKEIALEDQAAKSSIITVPTDAGSAQRIGVIEIPAFYRDFRAESEGDPNFRSTTRDVRQLVTQLKQQRIDGLIIDLRGNGGGSLTEATSLTGLFIRQGPVVQVKDAFGKIEVESDPDPDIIYDGPLAVMVDRNSASASEIFVGAIQDYGRGLIVGEPTFGKGTVQTLVDLNRYVPGDNTDLGRLRLTMAEFFRISGGSTQLKGVEPDIHFDLGVAGSDQGERSLENALPWSKISPANYTQYHAINNVQYLKAQSAQRTAQDAGFQMLMSRSRILSAIEAENTVSLQEQIRRRESDQREQVLKQERQRFLRAQGIEPVDEDAESPDEEALEKQQKIIDKIQTHETAHILADFVQMQ